MVLRLPDERDLAAIGRGLRDPDVIHSFGRSPHSAEQALDLNRRRWAEGDAATFAICDISEQCVGHVFVNLTTSGRAGIG